MTERASVRFTPRARLDLLEHEQSLQASAGPDVVLAYAAAVEAVVDVLASFPEAGSPLIGEAIGRPHLRSLVVRGFPFLVVHRVLETAVEVVRVLHERRDVGAALSGHAPPGP